MRLFNKLFGLNGPKKPVDEAFARKERSILILRKENVPHIEHLPLIETVEEAKRRTVDEVAQRAMALCAVALKAEGLEQERLDRFIKDYHIASDFSPKEKQFIENPNATEKERIQCAWRYECFWVMLWALGYIDQLDRPEKVCDVERAVSILHARTQGQFITEANLRPQSEILDGADLIYRYHWAVRDASIKGKEAPADLNADVVMERHHALNWLIGYNGAEWDDVTTDT